MAGLDPPPMRAVAPVASVWCRQVDNEAESPGYTTIPDDFPGYRDALESIRIVGNLTINVADTHDYWDPGRSQALSFYPNLFLYPAAGQRYTCVGRMFLSTEDRPRLGMKTLVFSTADLLASGDFGGMVLRAHATMDGRGEVRRPSAEPEPAVVQAVGEGFLFSKGSTDPVVVVASDQWDAAAQTVLDLVGWLPASLVALGAFLVFPYFLPAPKVNLPELAEQLPTSLAVMRVARGEAAGDRHDKRMKSWEELAVSLRDLTRAPASKKGDALPLVLQYIRDHEDEKQREVARRVDAVELPRLGTHLADSDRPTGKERRKEMWRIGAAMETAALLLSKPKGRTVSVSGAAGKRANEYLHARPEEPAAPEPSPAIPPAVLPGTTGPVGDSPQHPAWLRPPPQVAVPATDQAGVPVPTGDDPSLLSSTPAGPVPPAPAPAAAPAPPAARPPEPVPPPPPPVDLTAIDARVDTSLREQETKWAIQLEARLRDDAAAQRAALDGARADFDQRIAALEARPMPDPAAASQRTAEEEARTRRLEGRIADGQSAQQSALDAVRAEMTGRISAVEQRPTVDAEELTRQIDNRVRTAVDERAVGLSTAAARAADQAWTSRFTTELKSAIQEFDARAAKSEEELRAALAAQLDVELADTKEQGTALREEIEARVRKLLDDRGAETAARTTREIHDLEQRLSVLIEGRSKDLESRLASGPGAQKEKWAALADERVARAEQRIALEREARLTEVTEAHHEALAGLQVRMQSFVEGKLREGQEKDREQYLALLARMKLDVEQALARTVDAAHLDTLLQERVTELLERTHADQSRAVASEVERAEARIREAQQELVGRLHHLETALPSQAVDVGHLERSVRRELDDFDRRLKVVHDHILPMVRQTWLKVSQQESGGDLRELRQSLEKEIQQVEATLVAEVDQLRERLETAVAQHGRIWLNLIHQLSREEGTISLQPRSRSRVGVHRAARPLGIAPSAADGPVPAAGSGPSDDLPPEASNERRRLRRSSP